VPSGAGVALEDDVCSFVEREAVILVDNGAVFDGEVGSGYVEAITVRGICKSGYPYS
jgi:hypothetical protein